MPQSHVLPVRRLVEPLERILADRVEHAEAAAAPPPNQALLDERLEDVELGVAYGLRRVERKAAGEHRQPPEELLLVRLEQLVAPLDRRAQRALARRGVARGAGEERQAPVEPGEQLLRIEQREARRRELDRERKPVEPAADLADCRRRAERGGDRARALDEEDLGVGVPKRLNRVAPLRLDVQRLAARDEHLRVGRAADQRGHRRRGLDDLLEVVEEHEQALIRDVLDQAVVGADRRPDRPLDECGVADGLEGNPEDAVGKLLDRVGGELQREPRLAAPAGPGQRHQAVGANELTRLRELAPPADQRRRLDRQIRPIQRAQRRKVSVTELEEPVRGAEVLEAVLAEVEELPVPPRRCRVLSESRTCPPWPALMIRAARCTSMPTYPSSVTTASPVWIPIRTRTGPPASAA